MTTSKGSSGRLRRARFLGVVLTLVLLAALIPVSARQVKAGTEHKITIITYTRDMDGNLIPGSKEGGTVICQATAEKGVLVRVEPRPSEGYRVAYGYLKNEARNGIEIRFETQGWSFPMPDRDVEIDVGFQVRNPSKTYKVDVQYGVAMDAEDGNVVSAFEPGERVFLHAVDEQVPDGKYILKWVRSGAFAYQNVGFDMPEENLGFTAVLMDSTALTVDTSTGALTPNAEAAYNKAVSGAIEAGQINLLESGDGLFLDLDKDGTADVNWKTRKVMPACSIKTKQFGIESKNKEYSPVIFIFSQPAEWPFEDIPVNPGNWVYDAVSYVYNAGLMKGMNDHYFGAAENLQREQMAIILWNWSSKPSVSYSSKFSDVPPGAENEWYSIPILWASENGIVNGYTNGKFGVGDSITREQFCKMMYSYAKYLGYDVSDQASLDGFPDGNQVSDWALTEMKWAVAKGLVHGEGDGRLNPRGNVSRAVCATIIMNFIKNTSS